MSFCHLDKSLHSKISQQKLKKVIDFFIKKVDNERNKRILYACI